MNNPLDFPNQPVVNTPSPPAGPKRWASLVGDYARTLLIVVFWIVVLATALSGALVSVRALYWGVRQILTALGGW